MTAPTDAERRRMLAEAGSKRGHALHLDHQARDLRAEADALEAAAGGPLHTDTMLVADLQPGDLVRDCWTVERVTPIGARIGGRTAVVGHAPDGTAFAIDWANTRRIRAARP